jgi:outer membrane lipoprotein-sorting protein
MHKPTKNQEESSMPLNRFIHAIQTIHTAKTALIALLLFALSFVLSFVSPVAMCRAADLDGPAILRQVDNNLQPETYEMYRKLINIEPDGTKKEFVLYSVKKGSEKMVALFLSPASEKGRSTLRLGENMWLYIPNVGKPLRITSLQSVVGGVFNNSDILRLDYSTEYNAVGIIEEGDTYLLDLKAKTNAIAYDRLKMRVDKKSITPTTIECYAASGMLIKTLYYKDMKEFNDGLVRPSVLETDSPLHKGYKSVMIYAKINKKELSDEVFSLNYLPKVEELR